MRTEFFAGADHNSHTPIGHYPPACSFLRRTRISPAIADGAVAALNQQRGGSESSARARSRGRMKFSALNKWYRALEVAGVEFIDEGIDHGPGVRLQKGKPTGKGK